jgi:hypothetical protein
MNSEKGRAGGVFAVQCFDKDGNLKWETKEHNLVVNEGLKYMNDTFFSGSSYTASWFIGLVSGPGAGNTYAATDTLASHAGWTEFTNYAGIRGSLVLDAATLADPSITASSAPLSFLITGSGGVVAGAFVADVDTGAAGILFSVSNFLAPGDRTVVDGDTLNVTYTFSLDAA